MCFISLSAFADSRRSVCCRFHSCCRVLLRSGLVDVPFLCKIRMYSGQPYILISPYITVPELHWTSEFDLRWLGRPCGLSREHSHSLHIAHVFFFRPSHSRVLSFFPRIISRISPLVVSACQPACRVPVSVLPSHFPTPTLFLLYSLFKSLVFFRMFA